VRALLLLVLLVAACSGEAPIPEHDHWLEITVGERDIVLGKGFPLTVVRIWKMGSEPAPWTDDALAPLTVRLLETGRRENDTHVEETRRYECHAFDLGQMTLPAGSLAGPENRVVLKVSRTVDVSAPGPAELPTDLLAEPVRWGLWLTIAAMLAIAASAFVVVRRRRTGAEISEPEPAPSAPPGAPPPSPAEIALAAVERLRARQPETPEEIETFHVDAANVMRSYVGARFEMPTSEMTSNEILAGERTAHRADLRKILGRCDMVKFACVRPDAAERERLLTLATTYVTETGIGEA
jgi:hypothetical protein